MGGSSDGLNVICLESWEESSLVHVDLIDGVPTCFLFLGLPPFLTLLTDWQEKQSVLLCTVHVIKVRAAVSFTYIFQVRIALMAE